MTRKADSVAIDSGATARTVQRLAVLLDAGLAPLAAWTALAGAPDAPEPVVAASHRAASAHELPAALRSAAETHPDRADWHAVAAALEVADAAGAPLAPALSRLAGVLRALAQTARDVDTALAAPVATAKIVLLLPLAGLGLGALLGTDALATLLGSPPGWCCLGAGVAALALAAIATRRLLATARRGERMPGLELELLAVALSGGMGVSAARQCVAGALALDANDATDGAEPGGDRVLAFATASGVPAGALLRAEAEEQRRAAAADGARRAAVLGVRLMLPLGLGLLPAFLALGVAPVLLALVHSTLGGL